MNRRAYLKTLIGGGSIGVSGCIGFGSDSSSSTSRSTKSISNTESRSGDSGKRSALFEELSLELTEDNIVNIKNKTKRYALSVPVEFSHISDSGEDALGTICGFNIPPQGNKKYLLATEGDITKANILDATIPHPVFKGDVPPKSENVAKPIHSKNKVEFKLPFVPDKAQTVKYTPTIEVEAGDDPPPYDKAEKKNGSWIAQEDDLWLGLGNYPCWISTFNATVATLSTEEQIEFRFPVPKYDFSIENMNITKKNGELELSEIKIKLTAQSGTSPLQPRLAIFEGPDSNIWQHSGNNAESVWWYGASGVPIKCYSPDLAAIVRPGSVLEKKPTFIQPASGEKRIGKSTTVKIRVRTSLQLPIKKSSKLGIFVLNHMDAVADYTWYSDPASLIKKYR